MSAIIATIGGYDISRVGHRVVYIKGFTRRYSSYRQEAITLQESGAGSYNRGKSQREYRRACTIPTQSAERNGNGYPAPVKVPTPEEWLHYSVKRLKEDGCEDLLWRYLID